MLGALDLFPNAPNRQGGKLFELKTMCSFVTLRDRSEPIVAHPDCGQCQTAELSWLHGKLRITARVVLDRGKYRLTCGHRRQALGFHWHAQVYGRVLEQELDH